MHVQTPKQERFPKHFHPEGRASYCVYLLVCRLRHPCGTIRLVMKRLFAILLMLILPLQWSYAAVADYCQHEEVVAAQDHFGHHAHKHVEHVEKSPDDKAKKISFGDIDCPNCQHSTSFAIHDLPAATIPHASVAPITFLIQSIPHRSPDNPFRPPLAVRS